MKPDMAHKELQAYRSSVYFSFDRPAPKHSFNFSPRVASSCGARTDQGFPGHLAWHAAFVAAGTRRRGRDHGPTLHYAGGPDTCLTLLDFPKYVLSQHQKHTSRAQQPRRMVLYVGVGDPWKLASSWAH